MLEHVHMQMNDGMNEERGGRMDREYGREIKNI